MKESEHSAVFDDDCAVAATNAPGVASCCRRHPTSSASSKYANVVVGSSVDVAEGGASGARRVKERSSE